MPKATIKAANMQLGDFVRMKSQNGEIDAFDTSIVKNINDDEVTLYRPYGTNFRTVYSGRGPNGRSIIVLQGHEEYSIHRNSVMEYELIRSQIDQLK